MEKKLIYSGCEDRLLELSDAAARCNLTPEKFAELSKENGMKIYRKTNTVPNSIILRYIKHSDFVVLFGFSWAKEKEEIKNTVKKSVLQKLKLKNENKLAQFKSI